MTPRAFYYRVPCALGLSAFPLSHFLLTFLFRILLLTSTFSQTSDARSDFRTRDFQALSEDDVRTLVELEPPQWTSVSEGHLGKILIPRVSGSENNTLVQRYISSVFLNLKWHEEQTPFTGSTPIGDIAFNNLIYTFEPNAPRKLVLAAHFDSLYFPDYPQNQFIGATDSAAPCAMLLDLAEALTPLLEARRSRISSGTGILRDGFDEDEAAETTLQLIFFDGEEAFRKWSDTDSIYGARHLASLWDSTFLPSTHAMAHRRFGSVPTVLDTIDHLVLLDLLGSTFSRIYSYYRETDWLFAEMEGADRRLREAGLVEVERRADEWFGSAKMHNGMIGDDHVPVSVDAFREDESALSRFQFLERGVSVLHVISNPFPQVWHTLADDGSALSLPALQRWNRILRVFTSEYLGLAPTISTTRLGDPPSKIRRSEHEL
ncbi:MAG: hypothetical protein TREMPRED_003957 [Tremellales sp. Tagirdzhanova-0007]|nr:MAG: hypothetical protein TREMPRED_003957 [Tremellales sp. Tagirdzhanova-0007]